MPETEKQKVYHAHRISQRADSEMERPEFFPDHLGNLKKGDWMQIGSVQKRVYEIENTSDNLAFPYYGITAISKTSNLAWGIEETLYRATPTDLDEGRMFEIQSRIISLTKDNQNKSAMSAYKEYSRFLEENPFSAKKPKKRWLKSLWQHLTT
jgi:hypothetical protein